MTESRDIQRVPRRLSNINNKVVIDITELATVMVTPAGSVGRYSTL